LENKINISRTLNKEIFEQLFKDYFKPLTGFALKFTKDLDSAKEIVHETFVKLWEKRNEIDPDKAVKSYLYTTVNNRCLNFIRDRKKFVDNEAVYEKDRMQAQNPSENSESIEIGKIIEKTIESLPNKCREVFLMSRFEELKYQEIADKLNISIKTVETQISKALKILRLNLSEFLTIIFVFFITNF
jgi:RNA polymerase sigma-70 factor (ECF subfamily)